MAYQWTEKASLLKRLKDEPRRFIQVIYGPRHVGKTTLVRQIMEELDSPHHLVAADAVPAGDGLWIAQQWENVRIRQQQQADNPFLLVIEPINLSLKTLLLPP
jgi:uncharacterized protein